nr:xylulose kinase-1 [Tanacetum cinerariifolium]
MINAQVDDLSSHNSKYTSPALTPKVFANMRSVGKGFSGVETPLFDNMLVQQQVQADAIVEEDEDNEVSIAPTPPSPIPATTPPHQQEPIPSPPQAQSAQPSSPLQQKPTQPADISESSMTHLNTLLEICATLTQKVANLEQDKVAQALEIIKFKQRVRKLEKKRRTKHSGLKRLRNVDTDEAEPTEVEKCLKRRRGVVIQDPEETTTTSIIMHSKNEVIEQVKRKERQDNEVMRYQALKRKPVTEAQARKNMMIYLKNMARFKMDVFKGMTYSEIRPIFEKHYNSIQAFLEKEEEEVTIQKRQATPLALKVHVVNYQIHHENNKPYYKIIRADGTHKLFLSFITLLNNFDREDLETLWKLVKKRFKSTKPKNFSDDFLLNTLKIMFEKPNVEVNMFLLVEKKYLLIRFTLEQMLNNVRLEVEEESEMSLELLSYIKYALTVNPTIYVTCIKQFWNTVVVKQLNDVTRLQALVDRKKVVITEAAIRDVLCLDDAEGINCLPNEEIFAELGRMGYEKPSTKITLYKAFFSIQ